MLGQKQLFDFMLDRVAEFSIDSGLKPPQAFAKWFASFYFPNPNDFFSSDASGDGKVDAFFHVTNGKEVQHYLLNTKFTEKYDAPAPVAFYDEITRFWQSFRNREARPAYLKTVRPELRQRYRKLFDYYDNGHAELVFVTNHRRNEKQYEAVKSLNVQIVHLNEMLQFVVDYIEDAMPRTSSLLLTGISSVLSADKRETKVPTSIVFARLVDLIRYMKDDPYDRLFARNIRLVLRNSKVNPEIAETFEKEPTEFVFSNNGITMLCESHSHDPGTQELRIENPRVVNGSQTLHSVREIANPSPQARVMMRIIQVRPPSMADFSAEAERRREVINKISIRSNLQNPIKKWNLIANDDYQHDIARFFRQKKFYYERRAGEWSERRTELKSVGTRRGPNITLLTQLIASFKWDVKQLGPVSAKSKLSELFEEAPYRAVSKTTPETAYQIYLLDSIIRECVGVLAVQTKYIHELASYGRFSLFTLCVRALESAGAKFGDPALTAYLEQEARKYPTRLWRSFCKSGLEAIRGAYKMYGRHYKASTGNEPSIANFTKSQEYLGRFVAKPLPRKFQQLGKRILG